MIRGVTFDLDGVYFPNGKANFLKSLEKLGVSTEEGRRVFLKSEQMNSLYKNGKMTDQEFWTWAAEEWKLAKRWDDLVSLLIDGYEVDDRVIQTIKSLRSQGIQTFACSNNFPARVLGLQHKFGFLDNFDTAVFSFEVGESKPSKRIFETLIGRAQLPPEQIVFADDNAENLAGAEALGITTFLYKNYDQFLDELKSRGVPVS